MSAQNLIELGYNVAEVDQQTQQVVASMRQVLDVAKQLNGFQVNISDWSAGIRDFKINSEAGNATTQNLSSSVKELSNTLMQNAKAREAVSKANIAEINQRLAAIKLQKQEQDQIQQTTKAIEGQTNALENNNGISVIAPLKNISAPVVENNGISIQQPNLSNTVADAQTTALKNLNDQYKLLQQNTKNAILNFGDESVEAKNAGAAEIDLKTKIDSLTASYQRLIQQQQTANQTKALPSSVSVISPGISNDHVETNGISVQQPVLNQSNEELKEQVTNATQAGKAYELFTDSVESNIKAQIDYKNQLAAIKTELSNNQTAFDNGTKSEEEFTSTQVDLIKQQTTLKQSLQDVTKTISLQLKAIDSGSGSIADLRSQYNLLYNVFTKLSSAQQESPSGQELNKDLDALKSKINETQKSAGDFSANVGRYIQSIGEPLIVLEKELQGIREQLQTMSKTDPGFGKLSQQEQLLSQLTTNLNRTFPGVRQEMTALNNTAQILGETFGIDSKEFQSFVSSVGTKENEIKNIQKTLNFQASNTRYLDGILNAVNGVVSAYGALNAAQALFGNGSKQSAEEAQKFQEVLTLVVSVQQLFNVISKESATVQTALAAKTAIVTAAQKINAAVRAALTTSTHAAVIADVELAGAETAVADSTIATTTALEAQMTGTQLSAASMAELGIAMDAEAVSAEAATAATTGFATALTATGIVAIIAAIGAGVVYIIDKLSDSAKAFDDNIEVQKSLADVLQKTNDVLQEQVSYIKSLTETDINYYNNQLKFSQASGDNQQKQFALRKKIADSDKQQAQDVVNALGASYGEQAKLATQLQSLDDQKQKALQGLLKTIQLIQEAEKAGENHGNLDDIKESFDKQIELFDKQYSSVKSQFDAGTQALRDLNSADADQKATALELDKYNADEKRKLVLAEVELEVGLEQDKNNRLLADDKNFYDDRIHALQSNLDAQKRLIEAQRNDVVTNPSSSTNDISIANQKATDDSFKAQQEYYLNVQAINLKIADDANENFAFRYAAEKRFYQSSIELIDNDASHDVITHQQALDERTKAYNRFVSEIKKLQKEESSTLEILPVDYNNQQLAKLEDLHRKQLISDKEYYQKRNELQADQFNGLSSDDQVQQQLDVQKRVNTELLNGIKAAGEDRIAIIGSEQAKATAALNEYYQTGEVKEKDYQEALDNIIGEGYKKRKLTAQDFANYTAQIQTKAQAEVLAEQIRNAEAQQAQLNKFANANQFDALTNGIDNAEASLAKLGYRFDEATHKLIKFADTSKDLTKLQANLEFAGKATSALIDLTQELVTAGYEKEINAIQALEDANNTRYQTEINNIQNSTLSEQDKAAKVTQLQAEQATAQAQLDAKKRQEQTKEARVAKIAQEASIIATTAQAIIAALAPPPVGLGPVAGIPFSIEVGIIGALQLAKVIATPVPQYYRGIKRSEEGWALTDERGPEFYIEPSGNMFFGNDTPTYRYLEEGTEIIPHEKVIDHFKTNHFSTDTVNEILYKGMLHHTANSILYEPKINAHKMNFDYEKLESIMNKSMKNQKRPYVKIINKLGDDISKQDYIRRHLL